MGEFVIKDALLDQYSEEKPPGHFLITRVHPLDYSNIGSDSRRNSCKARKHEPGRAGQVYS
ncbi:DUF3275 family protein [Pseudomonas sp. JV449]|uniref:DUF3275 family protein n=1 Tax=Pseudomonas sp. JV449 TaxID=1890658 RepID=UPI0028F457F7|nr:DUF3275 family protein [Pseudomonas sp. JV449]